ncbi:hypothetical protein DFS33DRAFT_1274442 [Desarmillaria ectypa]|nr:hypothetical protein DFS33DRAFT_1274442 [Desarmillaria ectypa]
MHNIVGLAAFQIRVVHMFAVIVKPRQELIPSPNRRPYSERQERVSLRSRGLQSAPFLTLDDDKSGNLGSSVNGRGKIDNDDDDGASVVQPDPSRDTPVAGPTFAYGLQKVPMSGDLPYFNDNRYTCMEASGRIAATGLAISMFAIMNGCEYVFLFGGFDDSTQEKGRYSELIAIDVRAKMWAYVSVVGSVEARIDATIVGIDDRLYVEVAMSKVVAFFVHILWQKDELYNTDVPNLGFGGRALPVYDGMKILLTPGHIQTDTVRNYNVGAQSVLKIELSKVYLKQMTNFWPESSGIIHMRSNRLRDHRFRCPVLQAYRPGRLYQLGCHILSRWIESSNHDEYLVLEVGSNSPL